MPWADVETGQPWKEHRARSHFLNAAVDSVIFLGSDREDPQMSFT